MILVFLKADGLEEGSGFALTQIMILSLREYVNPMYQTCTVVMDIHVESI